MLGGDHPIFIFQFAKLNPILGNLLKAIPVLSDIPSLVEQPPIPVYLNEEATGILLGSQGKNVDVRTDVEAKADGSPPTESQSPIGSTVTVNLYANKGTLGIVLLSSLVDLVFEKVKSDEYAITYLNGATTVFRARLSSYAVDEVSDNTLMSVKIELTRGEKTPAKEEKNVVPPVDGPTSTNPPLQPPAGA